MNAPIVIVLGLTLAISACATHPVSNAEATHVPNERLLSLQFLRPAAGTVEVTVKRDSGVFGAACSSRIFVNGTPVADLDTSEKVVLHLPEGEHILSAWPNGMCGGGMSEVNVVVRPGKQLNFRVGYGSSGDFAIHPTAF